MRFLLPAWQIVRADKRAYLMINVMMYGLVLIGFVLGLLFPELPAARVDALQRDGTGALVVGLLSKPWLFAAAILGVNVLRMGVASIVLPSMLVPFAGLPVTAYWAFTTGITLVPAEPSGWVPLVPHSLTIVVELQAYVLLLLGAFVLGRSWVRPRAAGAATRRQGYLSGLKVVGVLALPASALLVVGALWEAFSLFAVFSLLARS